MNKKTIIPAGKSPVIHIESLEDDGRIKGYDQLEIVIRSDDETVDYEVDAADGTSPGDGVSPDGDDSAVSPSSDSEDSQKIIKIRPLMGDSTIEVPINATLHIGSVGGDLQIRSVRGHIEVGNVGEDLSASKTGAMTLQNVGGDLSIKRASGDIAVANVGEDASCVEVEGDLTLTAGADVSLHDNRGNLTVHAGDDVHLSFSPNERQQYSVVAGADVVCYLPDEASAEVMLRSGNRTLRVRGWKVPPPPEDEIYTFTLGDGDAKVNLSAGGDITLASQSSDKTHSSWFDYDIDLDFGPGFQFRFDSDSGFKPEQLNNLFSEKIQSKVQNAMRQAEEQISNAISHVESRIENAEQRAADFESKWSGRGDERRERRRSRRQEQRQSTGDPREDRRRRSHRRKRGINVEVDFNDQASSSAQAAEAPTNPPVTEAERLMVLRMVEEGKVSVEQAEKLLAAMGS